MASLSLIGIPLTGGFMSKIYVANAAIASGLWVYTAVLLFWTLLTAIYLFRVLNSAYFEAPESPRLHRETGARALVPMLILGTASVLLGFFVEVPMAVIRMAAGLLVGGGL
jgi:multicomponent Na+:H+ antiporter subunit D